MLNFLPVVLAQVDTAAGTSTFNEMVTGVCGFIQPLVGHSKVLSLLLVIGVLVMAFLWYFNENKEGVMIWVVRVALIFAIILNVFTFPQLIGLPPVCGA